MKAPFSYYGGKMGMASKLVAMMPAHRTYIEPFFGSGAVFFAKQRVLNEIINDSESNVTTFFRVLRDQLEDLELACLLTPHARDEYEDCSLLAEDLHDVERARRFFTRVSQGFANTGGESTGWKVTTARYQSLPATLRSRVGRFAPAAERLAQVSIENCDAADLIERLATEDTFIYEDPPYLKSTRRLGRNATRARDYRHEMDDDESHERLAEVNHRTPAKVMLSGYPSPLYDALYADWHVTDFEVVAASSNARTTSRTGRTERIWCNYEPPAQGGFDFAAAGRQVDEQPQDPEQQT